MATVARDTKTGGVLELMILPALRAAGYACAPQVVIGTRPGGRRHKIDVLATDREQRSLLISVKWQQATGTTEQKVPFEIICLAEAMRAAPGKYAAAYLVLGGTGWTLRDYYTGGGLSTHLRHADLVRVLTLEEFVARANRGSL